MRTYGDAWFEGNLVGRSEAGATFSDCRRYRYTLWRKWQELWEPSLREYVAFIGLNPSTADEKANDPTVTRCINFAKKWGYSGMVMLNVFAYRATDPKDMKAVKEPGDGLDNDIALIEVSKRVGMTICCWGIHGMYRNRSAKVLHLLRKSHVTNLMHFGLTKDGQPKHPLYLPNNVQLQFFSKETADASPS